MGRTPYLGAFSSPRKKDRARVREVIAEMGLDSYADRPINELSGGEKQRIGFARALVQGSPLVVMDEPTAALDMGNQIRTLKKMRELARKDTRSWPPPTTQTRRSYWEAKSP